MGLLRSLIDSAPRFVDDLARARLAIGYDDRPINWVIEIDPDKDHVAAKGPYRQEQLRPVPMRADRSGKISSDNIKPNLLVDNARYVLGLEPGPTTGPASRSFLGLHIRAADEIRESGTATVESERVMNELRCVVRFLELDPEQKKARILAGDTRRRLPKANELVAFATTGSRYLFDSPIVQGFWKNHLAKECGGIRGTCGACSSSNVPLLRILPFKIRLFGERCPLASVNTDEQQSFASCGKEQLRNSPLCLECAGTADIVLKHLVKLDNNEQGKEKGSGRHAVVLSRDDTGKQPMRNQMAVFWTKEPLEIDTYEGAKPIEDMNRLAIETPGCADSDGPPAHASQMRGLLESPFKGGTVKGNLATNRFYLAVLSPNKSRLVVREWLDQDVEPARQNLKRYIDALQIVHPARQGVWFPPLSSLLEALRSPTSARKERDEKPRLPQVEPDLTRKLIRCMYTGTAPPQALLTRAVRCFRVPDPPSEDRQSERQMLRRMALAAAMKLVITYEKEEKERHAMEELVSDSPSDYKIKPPYLCGQMLAILEAVQRRASSSGHGVNTTLVDRFYGAASTAPATVFANLINMATKAHLPKLRREGKEYFRTRHCPEKGVNVTDLLCEVCDNINAAGGFPPPLTPEQQAQFALGFYHQRAELTLPKKQ